MDLCKPKTSCTTRLIPVANFGIAPPESHETPSQDGELARASAGELLLAASAFLTTGTCACSCAGADERAGGERVSPCDPGRWWGGLREGQEGVEKERGDIAVDAAAFF